MRPIIVGIDPGTTAAFAAIDFDFNLLKARSKKDYSIKEMISDIYNIGNPILVGTDKKEIPGFIKEFSNKTGAKIFTPGYDTKKPEKKTLVKDWGWIDEVANAHETDALASAIYACKDIRGLVRKIDNHIKENELESTRDKIIMKVIMKNMSIKEASRPEPMPEKKKSPKKEQEIMIFHEPASKTKEEETIELLTSALKRAKNKAERLAKELKEAKKKKIDISSTIKKKISFKEKRAIELEKENIILKKKIAEKDAKISQLNWLILRSQKDIIVKRVKNLGNEEMQKKAKKLEIEKGDVIFADDATIIGKDIPEYIDKMKALIYTKGPNKNLSLPQISRRDIRLLVSDNYAIVKKDELEKAISAGKSRSPEYIKKIFDEYKKKRSDNI